MASVSSSDWLTLASLREARGREYGGVIMHGLAGALRARMGPLMFIMNMRKGKKLSHISPGHLYV